MRYEWSEKYNVFSNNNDLFRPREKVIKPQREMRCVVINLERGDLVFSVLAICWWVIVPGSKDATLLCCFQV